MKQATFSEGILIALLSSVSAAAIFMTLSTIFLGDNIFRVLVAGLSFTYIMYLLLRSHENVGRVTTTVLWFLITISSAIFTPSLVFYTGIQLLMIWLIRSLYYYSSVLTSLLDLGLTGISLITAIWAWTVSQSVFLTFWSFFLVQALFVYIPKKIRTNKSVQAKQRLSSDKFEEAYRCAELAVRNLTTYP
jgi:hypothetical protein